MATSVVGAVLDLYNAITPATVFGSTTRPPIYLDQAPPTDANGTQLRPPYVVLHDLGQVPTFNGSYGGYEVGEIRLEVFAVDLGAASGFSVDSIVAGIKYGGSAPSAKAGLDGGAFTLTGYLYRMSLKRTREQRSYAGFNAPGLDHVSRRVHKCELSYRIVVGLNAS